MFELSLFSVLMILQLGGNAFSPISVTLFGIVTFVSDEHFEKVFLPIFVTPFGIVIFISEEHLEKAFSPIFVTLFGIVNDKTANDKTQIRYFQFIFLEK